MISTDLTMDQYLRINAVSQGVLQMLIDECPRAAWHESYMNTLRTIDKPSDEMDVGTVSHAIFLEGSEKCVQVIDPADYPTEKSGNIPQGFTNNAIRAARDLARENGLIPILWGKMASIRAMVDEARRYVESLKDDEPAIWRMFQPDGGRSEVTCTWDDDGVPCKIRVDRISNDCSLLCNYKTTATSVEPARWGRAQLYGGYDFSDAFYRRGARAVYDLADPALHFFMAQSTAPPYLCSLVSLDSPGRQIADEKVAYALREWRKCVAAGKWPGFPTRIAYVETPAYLLAQWESQMIENGVFGGG